MRINAQQSAAGILINCCGELRMANQDNNLNFNHVFLIVDSGGYYIHNEIFRVQVV
jgi:hypothetical protein